MKRHANAHAYVNAACLLTLDGDTISSPPTLVFGGVGSKPFSAPNTCQALQGLSLTDSASFLKVLSVLSKEVPNDTPPAGASVAYRQQLALTLLYKCLLAAQATPSARLQSAAEPYVRPTSSASIKYDTVTATDPVGRAMPKATAYLQTSGEARYTADQPPLPHTLYAAFALADTSNAVLETIDFSVASTAPGVHSVMAAVDLPPNYPQPQQEGQDREPLFVAQGERVMFHGQAIGMVLADTQAHADAAVKLVTATYSDQQPLVLTIEDAIAAKSFFDDGVATLKFGEDITKALGECDKVSHVIVVIIVVIVTLLLRRSELKWRTCHDLSYLSRLFHPAVTYRLSLEALSLVASIISSWRHTPPWLSHK
jgi:xanthine dehydrogenase/oxidase